MLNPLKKLKKLKKIFKNKSIVFFSSFSPLRSRRDISTTLTSVDFSARTIIDSRDFTHGVYAITTYYYCTEIYDANGTHGNNDFASGGVWRTILLGIIVINIFTALWGTVETLRLPIYICVCTYVGNKTRDIAAK